MLDQISWDFGNDMKNRYLISNLRVFNQKFS